MPQRAAYVTQKNLGSLATDFQLLPICCILTIFSEGLDPCRLNLKLPDNRLALPCYFPETLGVHAPSRTTEQRNSALGCHSTEQEGHSNVKDLGCLYMPAPYGTCAGTEDVPQWHDTGCNDIRWPCCTYYRDISSIHLCSPSFSPQCPHPSNS